MQLTVNKVKDTISGVVGKDRYSVPFNEETFKNLQALENDFSEVESMEEAQAILERAVTLTKRNFVEELKEAAPNLIFDVNKNQFFLKQNDVVSSIAVPKTLAERIVKAHEEGLSITPLIRAWVLFLRNPKFTPAKAELFAQYINTTNLDREEYAKLIEEGYSQEAATNLATYYDVAISKNGLLSTYKYATVKEWTYDPETGKRTNRYAKTYDEETGAETTEYPTFSEDYHLLPPCMGENGDKIVVDGQLTHRISIGKVHTLPSWDMVNCNDDRTGCKGLHLGGNRYVQNFGGQTEQLLNCLVSPDQIGAFDRSGVGAVRCKEYYVQSANFAPNKQMYNESNYAAKIESDWAVIREEAITASNAIIERQLKAQAEIKAL